ncbi:MAG: hypothetical protein AAF804_02095 [Bacteroidota bacterium]
MKYLPSFWILLGLLSCEPPPPDLQGIRSHLMGRYCIEDYELSLSDSTYQAVHRLKGPLGVGTVKERCKGNYLIQQDSLGQWLLLLSPDPWPQSLGNCGAKWVIWVPQTGYVYDRGDTVALPSPLNPGVILKQNCLEKMTPNAMAQLF